MSIIVEQNSEGTTLIVDNFSLAGDMAAELKVSALEVLKSGTVNIFLDLGKPEFIDSSGIGKLLFLSKKIKQLEGRFSIVKINSVLYDFLDSLAITKVMEIAKPG